MTEKATTYSADGGISVSKEDYDRFIKMQVENEANQKALEVSNKARQELEEKYARARKVLVDPADTAEERTEDIVQALMDGGMKRKAALAYIEQETSDDDVRDDPTAEARVKRTTPPADPDELELMRKKLDELSGKLSDQEEMEKRARALNTRKDFENKVAKQAKSLAAKLVEGDSDDAKTRRTTLEDVLASEIEKETRTRLREIQERNPMATVEEVDTVLPSTVESIGTKFRSVIAPEPRLGAETVAEYEEFLSENPVATPDPQNAGDLGAAEMQDELVKWASDGLTRDLVRPEGETTA